MVSNNPNLKYNVPMQAGGLNPSMQSAIDAQKVKQSVDNSYLANRVKASEEVNPTTTLGLSLASWYLLAQGMDKFGPKCEGAYDKTVFGRLGNWGDKVQNKFTETSVGKYTAKGYNRLSNFWQNLTKKSKLAYAVTNTPTQAEWKFAKNSAAGLRGFLVMDTEQLFDYFMKPIKNVQQLEQFGYTQEQINKSAKAFQNLKGADKRIAFAREELKALGASEKSIDNIYKNRGIRSLKETLVKERLKNAKNISEAEFIKNYKTEYAKVNGLFKSGGIESLKAELVKADINPETLLKSAGTDGLNTYASHLKARKLGFRNLGEYQSVKKDALANTEKIYQALLKSDDKMSIAVKRNYGRYGEIKGHLFGRKVGLSELRNKFTATLGRGNTTKLGRFLPKALGYFLEGTTNRFAGGKYAVLMQAFIFGDMLANTFNAPKGEKFKTFTERFVNDFTYFLALPLGCILMNKVAGMKYAGVDQKTVEAYRKALAEFKADVKADKYTGNKQAFKAKAAELKNMLKADIKNPITKLFKKAGSLIDIGNGSLPAYKAKGFFNGNLLRKIPNFFKNLAGVPLRLAIPMALVVPFVAKAATKAAHTVFGRPTKSVLDETKEPEQTDDIIQPQTQNNPFQNQTQYVNNSKTNLLNMYKNGQKYEPKTTAPDNSSVNKDKKDEPVRTYIPSPMGVQLQAEDPTSGNAALARADIAERKAMETLAMKW